MPGALNSPTNTLIRTSSLRRHAALIRASSAWPSQSMSVASRRSRSRCPSSPTKEPTCKKLLTESRSPVRYTWTVCTLAWEVPAYRLPMRPRISTMRASSMTCSCHGHQSWASCQLRRPFWRANCPIMTSAGKLSSRLLTAGRLKKRILSPRITFASPDTQL